MMINVFIDGREGTTGLQIQSRLEKQPELILLDIAAEKRKDPVERKRLINEADVVFLCLPDEGAREAAQWADGTKTVVIDASTAHRVNKSWAYGFPELSPEHERALTDSCRIAVPGCHATGFTALVYPLVKAGLIDKAAVLSCFSLTGYSGGGKKMIADYENGGKKNLKSVRPYALGLNHKHLPEMRVVCGLDNPPIFQPNVVPVRQGMLVSVPLAGDAGVFYNALKEHYPTHGHVRVMPFGGEDVLDGGFLDMEACNNTDELDIFVFGNRSQTLLISRFDNLGKGASGAAVQCMKLRMSIK